VRQLRDQIIKGVVVSVKAIGSMGGNVGGDCTLYILVHGLPARHHVYKLVLTHWYTRSQHFMEGSQPLLTTSALQTHAPP